MVQLYKNKTTAMFPALGTLLLITLFLFTFNANAQFTNGRLVVLQVGDGSAALSNAATPVFLKEFSTTGTAGFSVAIPSSGSSALTMSGSATSEGLITRSSDGFSIIIPGYNANAGTAAIAGTTSAVAPRAIGKVTASGIFTLPTTTTSFSANNPRGATSNGTNFWASGANTGILLESSGTGTVVSSTSTNNRALAIYNGNLYFSTGSGTRGVYQVGTGLPVTTGNTSSLLFSTSTSASSPYQFAFNSAGTVAYVADDATGIYKWTFNGTTWSSVLVNATTCRGLIVDFSGANPVIYATTAAATNSIIKITDVGAGYPIASTTVATASANTAFRGIAFAPETTETTPVANLSVSSNTGSETGSTVITVTATASVAVAGDQTVSLAVTGTNITATDYTLSNTTITIPDGGTTGSVTFTIADDADVEGTETAILTISNPSAGITLGGTTTQNIAITDNDLVVGATKIHDIQGSGSSFNPSFGGTQTIEGIVVGTFPGTAKLRGFYVQEEDADADNDPATSEGIFIFDPNGLFNGVAGTKVQVTGTVSEFTSTSANIAGTGNSSLTEITLTSFIDMGASTLPAVTNVLLPVANFADLERYEGMLVNVSSASGPLTVTETFKLGRFGQVGLSGGAHLDQYTQVNPPSVSGYANFLANLQNNYIILDDGSTTQNPDPEIFARGGLPLSATNTLRGGDNIASISGVMDQRFEGYRVQTTVGANFIAANPRPAAPSVGGNVKAAFFNVLNYFTDLDLNATISIPNGVSFQPRGANTASEFTRQRDKIISAITAMNADVIGISEMENDGNKSIQNLVDGLNAIAGPGTYAFINDQALTNDPNPAINAVGTDAIKVAIIYKPGVLTPVGAPTSYLEPNPSDPIFSRPPVAQTFVTADGVKFSVIVNHLKSKGSSAGLPGDADQNDGQGASNATRVAQAQALVAFINTVKTASGDDKVLVVGDMNAYALEDPMITLTNGGLTNLFPNTSYSYQFNGQWGSLDHALATSALNSLVAGAAKWHINSDEPVVLDYNTEFKSAGQVTSFYNLDGFRSSDHDPVIVGLNLVPNTPTTVTLALSANSAAEAGAITVTVTANASAPVSGDQTVSLNVSGTGITNGDYNLSNTTITIPNGTTSGSVTFTVTDDAILEGAETAILTISNPSAGITLGATTTQNITIADNETSINLCNYVRVGRYDLPEPTRTVAPPNNLLAQEVSGVTYNWDTETLFVVGDGGTAVVQVSKTGQLINTMTLAPGNSPQNTDFYDPEGITYVGNGKFVMIEERDRQAVLFTYVPGTTLTRANAKTVKLGTFVQNIGIEGLSYDPQTGGFICVKETQPQGIFQTGIDFDAGTATNGSATTENSINLFDPALANLLDFADVFALSNIPALNGEPNSGNLLVLSQESGKIVNIDRTGNISSSLTIINDPGNPLTVPAQQHEGLTMDRDGILYVVSENGGGDFDHPQLWVYAPSAVVNQAPSAITLSNSVTTLPENTSTTSRLKVGDINVADDGLRCNNIVSLGGADANFFEIIGSELYIKAGTVLDFETKSSYSISVNVDDATVGGTPDATVNYTLTLTDVLIETPPGVTLIVSEVAAWSSGNSPVGADWFELTNTGTNAVNITGWKVDDNSNSFAAALLLNGITTIAPGESVIFLETATPATTIPLFLSTWFGNNPPAGLQVGSYTGSGVGLSTGGDAVNIFNGNGELQAKVTFGTSPAGPSFPTFNNAIGLNNTAISTLSVVGVNDAFAAINDPNEIGSPGSIGKLYITEVAPWSSGNSPVGADWFEVTNTRATAVDITGWKMDDNSGSPAAAVVLNGITSIAPGESVIFLETGTPATTIPLFLSTWFGANPPAGLQVGSYSGSGVGLGTGGDAVNLYNNVGVGVLQASVLFGNSPTGPYKTFDNAAKLNNTTISQLSAVGVNGAFIASNDIAEIGSPGTIVNSPCPTITVSAIQNAPIACNGGTTTITVTATGGTAPYTGTGTFTRGAGTAILYTVTDARGCTASVVIDITEPAAITASASADNSVSCGTSTTLTVTATGGTGSLQYSLNGGAFQAGNTFTVGAGTYTVTVKDDNNCTATTAPVTVTASPDNTNPTITAPANVSACTNSGCTATGVLLGTPVTADNCTVASVTNNAPGAFPLGTTTVTWTVTDGSGNTATASQTVTVTDCTVPAIYVNRTGLVPGITGVSSSASPYLLPVKNGVKFRSILSVGDNIGGYQMVGIPDGLGAFDNNDGTFTLLMNHELGNTSGVARAHGAIGTFVSKWVINKSTLQVLSGSDLMQQVYNWNNATQSSNATTSTIALNRFCSGDLPAVSAFYNAATGLGTKVRIYMHGEEGGATGYQMGTVANGPDAGKSYVLGKFNLTTNGSGLTGIGAWENALANPFAQDKTIVIGNNDGGTGIMVNSVSVYVGTKTNTGTEVDKAGLTNGTLSFINVTGNPTEIVNTTTRATNITSGTAFTLSGTSSTTFSRPEDGVWNPADPKQFFFVTTDQIDQVGDGLGTQVGRSRLWRLNFTDITNPALGGTIDLLLNGTEGQVMFDNLTADKFGHLLLQEDVGNSVHNGKIWQYTIATGALTIVAKHDPARFGDRAGGVTTAATAPFNADEESSGIIDVSDILGNGMFITSDQAHYATGIPAALAEGGQLLAMFNPESVGATATAMDTLRVCSGTGVNLGTPATSDNCSVASVTNDAPSTFPVGNTTVTWTVTDGSGNTATATQVVIVSSLAATAASTAVTTTGGTDGTATVTATGGTAPYTYSWAPGGQTTATATGLAAGTYTVTVTDALGCSVTATTTVGSPACNLAVSASAGAIACNGGTTTLTATATGANGAVEYSLNGGAYQAGNTFTVSAGTYTVTARDAANCTTTSNTVIVTEPTQLLSAESHTSVLCFGGSSTVTISATGGTAPYTGTGTFNQPAGTQSYTVTDANGCTSSVSVTVMQPTQLVAAESHTAVSCFGGSSTVTISATGGTAPNAGTGTFTQAAGTQSYIVTDANGCTSSVSVTVTQPTQLVAAESHTSVSCFGGASTVTISATGGTTPYTGTGTFTQAAGTQSYTVTDANGCTSSVSVTVTQPAQLVATATSTPASGGSNGTASATATGGTSPYTYSWNTVPVQTTQTATGLAGGTYIVTVTDAGGCTTTATTTVTSGCGVIANAGPDKTICAGATVTLTASATGGSLSAPPPQQAFTEAPASDADMRIFSGSIDYIAIGNTFSQSENMNNCGQNATASKTLTLPSGAVVKRAYLYWSGSGSLDNKVKLNGTNVTADATKTYNRSGGYTYFGARKDVTSMVTTSGTYTVSDLSWSNGNPYCSDNSAYGGWSMVVVYELASLPNVRIHINTDKFQFTFPAGTYSSTIDRVNVPSGCSANAKLTIIAFEGDNYKTEKLRIAGSLDADLNNFRGQAGPNLDIITKDVPAISASTGSLTYSIETFAQSTVFGTSTEGVFDYVKILKYNNCPSGGCNGYKYEWKKGNTVVGNTQSINVSSAGTYTVKVTDCGNCSATDEVVVSASTLAATATVNGPISCNGGTTTVTLDATGGVPPYGGTATFIRGAGTWNFIVTDNTGCSVTKTVIITQPAPLAINATVPAIPCNGTTTTVNINATGGSAPYTGTGSFVRGPGTWVFVVMDNKGCIATKIITIANALPCGPVDPNKCYKLIVRHSGKALTVENGSTANGAHIEQRTYNGGDNQIWKFVEVQGGYYKIINANSGKVLDVDGGSNSNGADILQWTYNGGDDQKWSLVANGAYFAVKAKHSNKAMSVENFSTTNGANVEQRGNGTDYNAQWSIVEVGCPGYYTRTNGSVVAKEEVIEPYLTLTVQPNPSTSVFNLITKSPDNINPVNIKVLDVNGRVMSVHKTAANTTLRVEAGNWTNGIYFAEVIQGDQRKVVKMIKTN